jgi:hypothetical protein
MTTPSNDPFASLKEAWNLYQTMTEELASSHAQAVFEEETVSDTWGNLPEKIDATQKALYELAGPSDSHKERRHNRHERNEIAGVNETLGETHQALVERANAQINYLKLEQTVKQAMDAGEQGDLESLDMARSRLSKSRDALAQSRSTLSLRIENLADDSGSGLFSSS